jgi:hypothetical protein
MSVYAGQQVAGGPVGYRAVLSNQGVGVDPGVTDDASDRYGVGSPWVNINDGGISVLSDPTVDAAVWNKLARDDHTHTESDITDLVHYTSGDFVTDFASSNLANLAAKAHSSLTGIGTDDHHSEAHVHAITDLSDVAAKSGSGTTVLFQGSPTLTTPTIGSFTNATHSHLNAAGGGLITDASWGRALTGKLDTASYAINATGGTPVVPFELAGTEKSRLDANGSWCLNATVSPVAGYPNYYGYNASSNVGLVLRAESNSNVFSPVCVFYKARLGPGNLTGAERLGGFFFYAYKSSAYTLTGSFQYVMTSTTACKMTFSTGTNTGALTIEDDGGLSMMVSGSAFGFGGDAANCNLTHDAAGLLYNIPSGDFHWFRVAGASSVKVGADQTILMSGALQRARFEYGSAGILNIQDSANQTVIKVQSSNKLGFYGSSAHAQAAAMTANLTTITHTAPGTPNYALADLTNSGPFGFVTKDEGNTLLSVVKRLQTQMAEVRAILGTTVGVGLAAH